MLFCLGFEFRGDVQYAEKEWKQRSSREERKGGRGGGGCTSATPCCSMLAAGFLPSVFTCVEITAACLVLSVPKFHAPCSSPHF